MPTYAKETGVPVENSLTEIRKTLTRYGATRFAMIEEAGQVGVGFEMRNRSIRFVLPLPRPDAEEFEITTGNQHARYGTGKYSQARHEKAVRQRWRALALVIKAKLEAVESSIETFDEAFMAQIVLPNGQTMGRWATPQIEQAYLSGNMPPLLGTRS